MRKLVRLKSHSPWIALALALLIALAWIDVLGGGEPAYVAAPRLAPDLADLRNRLREGGHSGESFDLRVTDQEAAESIAWFLSGHPEAPFRYPRIAFHAGYVEAWGQVTVLGLRLSIHGRATMILHKGVPVTTLTDLDVAGAPVPGPVLEAIQRAFYEQVDLSSRPMPIAFETLDLREGEVVASGVIR